MTFTANSTSSALLACGSWTTPFFFGTNTTPSIRETNQSLNSALKKNASEKSLGTVWPWVSALRLPALWISCPDLVPPPALSIYSSAAQHSEHVLLFTICSNDAYVFFPLAFIFLEQIISFSPRCFRSWQYPCDECGLRTENTRGMTGKRVLLRLFLSPPLIMLPMVSCSSFSPTSLIILDFCCVSPRRAEDRLSSVRLGFQGHEMPDFAASSKRLCFSCL